MTELEVMNVITAAYCCVMRRNKEWALMGKLKARNLYVEEWLEMTLVWNHFRVQAAGWSIHRAFMGTGSQPRVKRGR